MQIIDDKNFFFRKKKKKRSERGRRESIIPLHLLCLEIGANIYDYTRREGTARIQIFYKYIRSLV